MKISCNWLAEYIDIPFSTQELADKLTMAGIEVEGIHVLGEIPEGVVVGEILERNPHPDADKLSVCKVNSGSEILQVVCGAPNCDAGKKVALATIGTVFVDKESGKDFPIKKCKLRGMESFGMMCSSRELGLDDEHAGIMELDSDLELGTSIAELFKPDTVLELEITSNRPDWLSHWGIARDIAALTGCKLKFPEFKISGPEKAIDTANLVTVEDKELCPRYTARVIKNVTVKESPEWLQKRLISIGLRPINNVVDITNFVLHELGHPLHAFDRNLLAEGRIVVRRAGKGEKIITLDEDEHELDERCLVIADAEKPVCLAGIMGGEHSGVTGATTEVLLESAVFNRTNIRESSRELQISSDSSYRFERGVDFEMAETASDRATAMILELAGGELVSGLVDVQGKAPELPKVTCNFASVKSLLGIPEITSEEIVDIFKRLQLNVDNVCAESCLVTAPSFRLDLERQADLAEEVVRIHGLDKVPVTPVAVASLPPIQEDSYYKAEKLRNELISLGLSECMNYSQTDLKSALLDTRFQESDLVVIDNPISADQGYMRPSLFSGMLRNVEHNISHGNKELALFEAGRVYCGNPQLFPEEHIELAIALTGRRHPERFSAELESELDFYDLKGLLETLCGHRKLSGVEFKSCESGNFVPGRAAEMIIGGVSVGAFGEVAKKYTNGMRLQHPLFIALLDFDAILAIDPEKIVYREIPHFPATSRDIAFVADESLENIQVMDFFAKSRLKNLEKVELFDIFRDEKAIGAGKKSMAYSLTFRNPERTLTDDEVNRAYEKIRKQLAAEFNIELR